MKSYLQESDKENQTSVSNSIETLNEVTFESEESILLDQSTFSTLDYESISDPFEKLKNTRLKNPNKLIIAQLNPSCLGLFWSCVAPGGRGGGPHCALPF